MDEVRLTIAEHPQTLDDGDVDRYVALFKENARLTAGGTEYAGRDAIRAFISGYFNNQEPGRQTKHLFGNSVIEMDGGRARSVTDVMVYGRVDDGPWSLATLTRHVDTLMPDGDRWLFVAKEIQRR
jgi:3-phenylpropionate/cinnamic acid dioxygenase small subunit